VTPCSLTDANFSEESAAIILRVEQDISGVEQEISGVEQEISGV
jgi:hypothetical protein